MKAACSSNSSRYVSANLWILSVSSGRKSLNAGYTVIVLLFLLAAIALTSPSYPNSCGRRSKSEELLVNGCYLAIKRLHCLLQPLKVYVLQSNQRELTLCVNGISPGLA